MQEQLGTEVVVLEFQSAGETIDFVIHPMWVTTPIVERLQLTVSISYPFPGTGGSPVFRSLAKVPYPTQHDYSSLTRAVAAVVHSVDTVPNSFFCRSCFCCCC